MFSGQNEDDNATDNFQEITENAQNATEENSGNLTAKGQAVVAGGEETGSSSCQLPDLEQIESQGWVTYSFFLLISPMQY